MSEKAKQILRDKIEQFEVEWATTADTATRFDLQKRIDQARADLRLLDSPEPVPAPAPSAPYAFPLAEVNPAATTLFVGRDAELAQMRAALLGPVVRPVALVGMAGVGKSYMADRFAHRHKGEFPGGAFRLVLDPENPPASAAPLLGELADRLQVPPEPVADLAERLRARLLAPRSLLHVENVDGLEAGRATAELARRLAGCPLIVSARLQSLGTAPGAGWERVELRWFSEPVALKQLQEELGEEGDRVPSGERERLVRELFFLPLAVHLAAGYLLAGQTVAGFMAELRAAGFDLEPADPVDPMVAARQGRELLASTLLASVRLLGRQLRPPRAHLVEGFGMLGFAQASGFGESLGAALGGLHGDEFETVVGSASRLSLLAPIVSKERRGRAWRLHPLLAEVLRLAAGEEGRARAHARTTEWFVTRLPLAQQGPGWQELGEETEALVAWLAAVPTADRVRVEQAGSWYAMLNGPFHAWRTFCEEALANALAEADRSHFLGTLGRVARRAGALDQALSTAIEKEKVDRIRGDEQGVALAAGLRADVLQARGELEEALRIRREEELPVYERLGDVWARAVALGKISDVLEARGELEEALRIRREEQLPVYESLGDVRERAVTLGKIADVLHARGEWEAALRIRREEELPVYERLGNVRSRAVTLGQIADVLEARGDLEEALRIRREEELPVYERLGDVWARAVTLGKIADVLEMRGEFEEALRIRREEELPVYERLGDVRSRAVTLGQIADVLEARGELEEALKIHREEELPVYERLGDVRERAVTLGKIADVLEARGEWEEALRIRREQELPVYEHLGDVRERAVALGKIADVLALQGDLEQAIEIYRSQVLPVDEQLRHLRDLVFDQISISLLLLRRSAFGDREEAADLLHQALVAAEAMRIPKALQIRRILHEHGLDAPPSPSLPGKAAG